MARIIALIPAAGMGKRMNAAINKQYLLLRGKPLLAHTLQVFQDSPVVTDIFVVTPLDEIPFCRERVVDGYRLDKVRAIVPGGEERQHSVLNGLRAMADVDDNDMILIHDGVRPFISRGIIKETAGTAALAGGAMVAVPAKDTVKIVCDGMVTETPSRSKVWLAQTPQAFRYGIIRKAHETAAAEGFVGTDDATLVERLGLDVRVVAGDYRNIKITTPEDMLLAEVFMNQIMTEQGE